MDYFQRKISLYRGNPYRSRLEEALKRVLFKMKGVPAPPGVLKRWVIFPSERDMAMTSLPWSSQARPSSTKGFEKMEFFPWNFHRGVPEMEYRSRL